MRPPCSTTLAALADRVEQFRSAIMAVDLPADAVAGVEVARGGRSNAIPGHRIVDGLALEAGEWFADVKAELGIQGQRTHVIAGLYQTHTREILPGGAMMDVLHQLSPDHFVLDAGIDGDRPDPRDTVTLVEEIAADDVAVKFGDDAVETGVTQHPVKSSTDTSTDGKSGVKRCASATDLNAW